MNILILGPPGSGKGTQAKQMIEKFQLKHVSTGDLLRQEVEKNSMLGRIAELYMGSGRLVPNDVVIDILRKTVEDNGKEINYLFDGFPRNLRQAEILEGIVPIHGVLFLDCDDEKVVERISGRRVAKDGTVYHIASNPAPEGVEVVQREDDKEEVVRKRLMVYRYSTKPLIDYYNNKGLLYTIDAARDIESVGVDCDKILTEIKNRLN